MTLLFVIAIIPYLCWEEVLELLLYVAKNYPILLQEPLRAFLQCVFSSFWLKYSVFRLLNHYLPDAYIFSSAFHLQKKFLVHIEELEVEAIFMEKLFAIKVLLSLKRIPIYLVLSDWSCLKEEIIRFWCFLWIKTINYFIKNCFSRAMMKNHLIMITLLAIMVKDFLLIIQALDVKKF